MVWCGVACGVLGCGVVWCSVLWCAVVCSRGCDVQVLGLSGQKFMKSQRGVDICKKT